MPRIKIISKLPKADIGGTQPPAYNFTGGPQSVWNQPNYAGAQLQGQQPTPPIQQQAASPQMFNPTGNVPQSMWGQQQTPTAQSYSVPKTGAWWESNADEPVEPVLDTTTTAAPNNGLPNQSTGLSKQFTGEDYDQPGYKGYKGPKKPSSDFMSGLSKVNNTIDQVATIGNMGLGYLDRQKKQKERDSWMAKSMQPHNYYAVNTKKNRGDYDVNNGMFQSDKLGYKSKGTQANNIGAMSTFVKYGGSLPKAKEGFLVPGDEIVNDAFLPDLSANINIPTAQNMYSSGSGFNPGIPLINDKLSENSSVEALANVQAKLESGYDPTKPPTAKENIKAWNVPASKTIYGKWQVSQDERKEAYKNLPELKNNFPTFQDYNNAFLGKDTAELQRQVQEITYKKYIAPRNLQLAGGDIFAAALYHYLPAAAKLYTEGKLDLNLKPGQLFPNNKTLVNADKVNPTFGSYLNRFKKEYIRQKEHNVFEQGGENLNNTNMKIRIIDGPEEEMANGGEPQYSGQSDYGLYIGQRNLYNTMSKSPFTDAGTTVEEKPEDEESPYVLEAEGGETILRPDGSHMKINGPSHAKGGVKLNKDQAPEGSFIYSDTNKMKIKNPKLLEYFGKSAKKGGITPAELAKQYNVNKYLGILKDPDTDKLSKQTAQRMVENYQKKLAELALAQESIKGFPQGIPEVAKSIAGGAQNPQQGQNPQGQQTAKYGGALHKFVNGGPGDKYDPEFLKAAEFMVNHEQQGSAAGPKGYVGGGRNWGTNLDEYETGKKDAQGKPIMQKIGSKEDAIKYYYDNYWSKVKDLPPGLRTRALQMAVNTGDPYGELMVAGNSFKSTAPGNDIFTNEKRIATKDQRKDLGPDEFKGEDWKKRKEALMAAYNQNPTQFMQNLDVEQNRYYNEGLNNGKNPAEMKQFHNDYYQGMGKIANEFVNKRSPISNDPFGVKSLIQNAGTTNNSTGTPVKSPAAPQQNNDYLNDPKSPFNSANAQQAGPDVNASSANAPAWFKPWTKSNTKAGSISPTNETTTFNTNDPNKLYSDYNYWKNLNGGKDFNSAQDYQKFVYETVNSQDPEAINEMWKKMGTTAKGKGMPKDQQFSSEAFADSDNKNSYFGARTAMLTGWQPKIDTTTTMPPVDTTTTLPPEVVTTTTAPPGVITTTTLPPGKSNRARWTNVDKRNLLNAGMDYASLKKYHPYSATIQPVLPEFIPTDWRGYAATLQSGANKAADQLGTYGAGQGMASNLSFLAGQQAGQLGDYISKVDQYNAAGSSNVDAQRANILNQYTQYNAANRDKNFADENVYDDKYRTAERLARKGIVKSWNTGDVNAAHIYNLNEVESPYSTIDPATQQIRWNPNGGKAAWENAIRGSAPKSRYEEINDAIKLGKSSSAFDGLTGTDQTNAIIKAYGFGNTKNNQSNQPKAPKNTNVNPVPPTMRNSSNDDENASMQTSKFGGGVGASFVKSVSDWYEKLNYIADPNERQRLAEAYAKKMHFGK
jgi:hypothetical protein